MAKKNKKRLNVKPHKYKDDTYFVSKTDTASLARRRGQGFKDIEGKSDGNYSDDGSLVVGGLGNTKSFNVIDPPEIPEYADEEDYPDWPRLNWAQANKLISYVEYSGYEGAQ